MNDQLKVRATLQGISPARFEVLQELGIPLEDAGLFRELRLDDLRSLAQYGLPGDEIVRYVKRNSGLASLEVYARVRKLASEHVITRSTADVFVLEAGLEAGFSVPDIEWAVRHKISIPELEEASNAGITKRELHEVKEVADWAHAYIRGRKQGLAHEELMEALKIFPGLSDFLSLRAAGDTLDTIKNIVAEDRLHPYFHPARNYVEYRTKLHEPLGIEEARVLVEHRIHPHDYLSASREATLEEIIEAAETGLSLRAYTTLRNEQIRLKHHEIIEYGKLTGKPELHGIKDYIRALDNGLSFEQIRALYDDEMSLHYINRLFSEFGLKFEQLMEVKQFPREPGDYIALRQSGVSHDAIITESAPAVGLDTID